MDSKNRWLIGLLLVAVLVISGCTTNEDFVKIDWCNSIDSNYHYSFKFDCCAVTAYGLDNRTGYDNTKVVAFDSCEARPWE